MTNVVLVMSDEHNPRYSSTYGHPVVSTPHLDRLAARGTVYYNAYCASPLCVPSRSAFMTGRYVHEIDRYNNCKIIEGRYPSYGGVLAEQGVHTVYLGPAGNLYRDPHTLGFVETPLVSATERPLTSSAVRSSPVGATETKRTTRHGIEADCFAADVRFTDAAVEWLRERAPSLDRPWTITVNLLAPHPPYVSDSEHWHRVADQVDLPDHHADRVARDYPRLRELRANGGWDFSAELVRALRHGYLGAVAHVDDQLGRILDAVDDAGLTEQTVVIYTTDHGETLGRFGVWGKCNLYEDAARVPVVAAGPGFATGQRVRTPVSLLDVQATLFAAVGRPRPELWRGDPLQSVEPDDPRRCVFAEYHGPGTSTSSFMLRRGPWKLLRHENEASQLFHLDEDPDERHDRAAERPDLVADLDQELRAVCDPASVHARSMAFDERQRAALAQATDRLGPGATTVAWGALPELIDR